MTKIYLEVITTGLLLGMFLGTTFGCTSPSAAKPEVWHPTEYKSCSLGIKSAGLPSDLAVIANRMDLPFGRYDAISSIRPYIIHTDGTYNEIGSPINDKPYQTSITVAAWSPDGESVYLNRRWEDPQWAMVEILKGDMFFSPDYYKGDVFRFDTDTGEFSNLTQDNAVSYFNSGAVIMPPNKIVFTAFVNEQNKPYVMEPDGSNKAPYVASTGFTYGFHASPDNTKFAYHSNYQVYVGDILTGETARVNADCGFAFNPQWSPDSQHIMFLCGSGDNDANIWVADRDGLNPAQVASRNGYNGIVAFTYGYDFHGGGSDWISWAGNDHIVYGAQEGTNVELFRVDINTGISINIQYSNTEYSKATFPSVSPDGKWMTYSSNKEGKGKFDLYLYNLEEGIDNRITDVDTGCATRETYWRPNGIH